jgi:hypothetical protein
MVACAEAMTGSNNANANAAPTLPILSTVTPPVQLVSTTCDAPSFTPNAIPAAAVRGWTIAAPYRSARGHFVYAIRA